MKAPFQDICRLLSKLHNFNRSVEGSSHPAYQVMALLWTPTLLIQLLL